MRNKSAHNILAHKALRKYCPVILLQSSFSICIVAISEKALRKKYIIFHKIHGKACLLKAQISDIMLQLKHLKEVNEETIDISWNEGEDKYDRKSYI